jgi:undecaprenyl-diphosphatase
VSLWEAAVLGFVQGATEFLPVSSSGHLVIGQSLLGLSISGVHFEVAVHVATLLSVLVFYRSRLLELLRGGVRGEGPAWRYIGLLALGTVPAAVLGWFFGDVLEGAFEAPRVTGVGLLVTAGFLWSSRVPLRRELSGTPGWRAALVIGLAQSIALVPGISRSGATVVTGLWLGIEAEEAAAFSFLLAIPAIAGAAVLQLPDLLGGQGLTVGTSSLVLGGVVAAVTGVLAIWTFVALLARKSFHQFGTYAALVGTAFLIYLAVA